MNWPSPPLLWHKRSTNVPMMLLSKAMSYEIVFWILVFLTFWPEESDFAAPSAALPLFDLSFFTALRPWLRSPASASSAITSFSSYSIFISPCFFFRVCGLFDIAATVSAFLSGVSGRPFLAHPMARFLAILFGNSVPVTLIGLATASGTCAFWSLFFWRYCLLRSLAIFLFLQFCFLFWSGHSAGFVCAKVSLWHLWLEHTVVVRSWLPNFSFCLQRPFQ